MVWFYSPQTYKVNTTVFPILQMGQQRHREVKWLNQRQHKHKSLSVQGFQFHRFYIYLTWYWELVNLTYDLLKDLDYYILRPCTVIYPDGWMEDISVGLRKNSWLPPESGWKLIPHCLYLPPNHVRLSLYFQALTLRSYSCHTGQIHRDQFTSEGQLCSSWQVQDLFPSSHCSAIPWDLMSLPRDCWITFLPGGKGESPDLGVTSDFRSS